MGQVERMSSGCANASRTDKRRVVNINRMFVYILIYTYVCVYFLS